MLVQTLVITTARHNRIVVINQLLQSYNVISISACAGDLVKSKIVGPYLMP